MEAVQFKLERRGEVPEIDSDKTEFYRKTLQLFHDKGLRFLVGGTHAYYRYTGISRETKDFDVFMKREDYPRFDDALREAGFNTELTFPHWLGKIHGDNMFIDLIFAGGNGEAAVDEEWFENSVEGKVLDVPVRLCAPEELIWSKSYVMERERFDGGDVSHLILKTATRLNWPRLVNRFGPHWRVLLMHLVIFGFIYPGERGKIPREIMNDLLDRAHKETNERAPEARVCQGTLLSRAQYLIDTELWSYADARLKPLGTLTAEEITSWTDAARGERRKK